MLTFQDILQMKEQGQSEMLHVLLVIQLLLSCVKTTNFFPQI